MVDSDLNGAGFVMSVETFVSTTVPTPASFQKILTSVPLLSPAACVLSPAAGVLSPAAGVLSPLAGGDGGVAGDLPASGQPVHTKRPIARNAIVANLRMS